MYGLCKSFALSATFTASETLSAAFAISPALSAALTASPILSAFLASFTASSIFDNPAGTQGIRIAAASMPTSIQPELSPFVLLYIAEPIS